MYRPQVLQIKSRRDVGRVWTNLTPRPKRRAVAERLAQLARSEWANRPMSP